MGLSIFFACFLDVGYIVRKPYLKMKTHKFFFFLFFFLYSQFSLSLNDTLVVAYTAGPPFVIAKTESPTGVSVWLWERIAKQLDIPYTYKMVPFGKMMEGVENGTIDVSINAITVTADRSHKMDFTYPFYISNATVVVRSQGLLKRIRSFISPIFTLSFLGGFIFLGVIIFGFGVLLWWIERKKNPEGFRPGWEGVWDGIWWSVVTMTTVGYGDKTPKTTQGKMVALLWMFSGLFFISSLTASLASNLTLSQLSQSNQQILDFKEKKVGTVNGSGTYNFLKRHFFKNVSTYKTLAAGFVELEKGQIEALMYDEPIIRYRIEENEALQFCKILPVDFSKESYAFPFTHGHDSLVHLISNEIIKIEESLDWEMLLAEHDLSEL